MKFTITYTFRRDGLTSEQNLKNSRSFINAFGKWKPDEGFKVHAFLASASGDGGFILAETDDAKKIYAFVATYVFWISCRVDPVLDVSESGWIGELALALAMASAHD